MIDVDAGAPGIRHVTSHADIDVLTALILDGVAHTLIGHIT